jgi:hypothetical protein
MSEKDIPAHELLEFEARVRADPLTREEETHVLPQDRGWVAGSRVKDEEWAKAGFRYWPRWLILALVVCFFIVVFFSVAGMWIGLSSR